MFAKYFEYYTIILGGRLLWTCCIVWYRKLCEECKQVRR